MRTFRIVLRMSSEDLVLASDFIESSILNAAERAARLIYGSAVVVQFQRIGDAAWADVERASLRSHA